MKSKNWSEGRCGGSVVDGGNSSGADGGGVVVARAGLGISVIAKTDGAPASCAQNILDYYASCIVAIVLIRIWE